MGKHYEKIKEEKQEETPRSSRGQGKNREETKQTMKKKRKDAAIKTETVEKQEDEQSPEKVVKSKKCKGPKVKLDNK